MSFIPRRSIGHHRLLLLSKGRSVKRHSVLTIQRKDWGGGEVWFDGKLIQKDGVFLVKALERLNG